ncbi:hypothetical protein Pelo_10534 [Pelomyxa schiedti]|nr:hypothetical protein Pelo_10534 [Pelomyxa schiedti]
MVHWASSTTLVRAWAEDWVLRSVKDAVFDLPIRDSDEIEPSPESPTYFSLYVSVSPTMGVVTHSWFTHTWKICGCVGQDRLLAASSNINTWSVGYTVNDTNGKVVVPEFWSTDLGVWLYDPATKCNREWIVGFAGQELRLWKVAKGGLLSVCPRVVMLPVVISPRLAEFSPRNDSELIIMLNRGAIFVDLEASFKQGELVEFTKFECSNNDVRGVMWMADGSLGTLHHYSSDFTLINVATRKRLTFPKAHAVVPIDQTHAFVAPYLGMTHYKVYNTGDELAEPPPSLCVPCAHTTATEMDFSVRDGVTGFLFGTFTVPTHYAQGRSAKFYFLI